jgi:hypothetical protein
VHEHEVEEVDEVDDDEVEEVDEVEYDNDNIKANNDD